MRVFRTSGSGFTDLFPGSRIPAQQNHRHQRWSSPSHPHCPVASIPHHIHPMTLPRPRISSGRNGATSTPSKPTAILVTKSTPAVHEREPNLPSNDGMFFVVKVSTCGNDRQRAYVLMKKEKIYSTADLDADSDATVFIILWVFLQGSYRGQSIHHTAPPPYLSMYSW